MLRRRFERSTVTPTERVARERAAALAVAGRASDTQTGAEAPSPNQSSEQQAPLHGTGVTRTRVAYVVMNAPIPRRKFRVTAALSEFPTRSISRRSETSDRRTAHPRPAVGHSQHVAAGPSRALAISHLRRQTHSWSVGCCFRAPDTTQWEAKVWWRLEPGARAVPVGANEIESPPPLTCIHKSFSYQPSAPRE